MQSEARAARRQLEAIYTEHAPQKVCNIGPLLEKFAGREALLVSKVRAKYSGAAPRVAQTAQTAQTAARRAPTAGLTRGRLASAPPERSRGAKAPRANEREGEPEHDNSTPVPVCLL